MLEERFGSAPARYHWDRAFARDDLVIWSRLLGDRDGAEHELLSAWHMADSMAYEVGWELRGIVPIEDDPQGHEWAVIAACRPLDPERRQIFAAHGYTPRSALQLVPHCLVLARESEGVAEVSM